MKGAHTTDQPVTISITGHIADLRKPNLSLSNFKLTTADKQSIEELKKVFDRYQHQISWSIHPSGCSSCHIQLTNQVLEEPQ